MVPRGRGGRKIFIYGEGGGVRAVGSCCFRSAVRSFLEANQMP